MINIRDIAKAASVAAITVSRVINNSGNVNAVTRDRVQQAIEELHYVPNTLALLLSDITNPFWPTVARSGCQLTQQLVQLIPRPTALFAANNFIAVGALQALCEAGLRIPDDRALVCMDDISHASAIDPSLTAAAQPADGRDATAARSLIERLTAQRQLRPRAVILPPTLIIRRSCGQYLRTTASFHSHTH